MFTLQEQLEEMKGFIAALVGELGKAEAEEVEEAEAEE